MAFGPVVVCALLYDVYHFAFFIRFLGHNRIAGGQLQP